MSILRKPVMGPGQVLRRWRRVQYRDVDAIGSAAGLRPRGILRLLHYVELVELGRIADPATVRIDRHRQAGRTAAIAVLGGAEPVGRGRHRVQAGAFKPLLPSVTVEHGDRLAHRPWLMRAEGDWREDELA